MAEIKYKISGKSDTTAIAKSLTELQGGEFKLYLDGDLFKVMITFVAKK